MPQLYGVPRRRRAATLSARGDTDPASSSPSTGRWSTRGRRRCTPTTRCCCAATASSRRCWSADGRPCLLGAHLARLATSAAITGLAAPGSGALADTPSPSRWRVDRRRGRGAAAGARPRTRARRRRRSSTVSAVPDRAVAARRDGVAAVTLDRGVPARRRRTHRGRWPASKSLSYAPNTAALRHAERLGAQDVVFVGSDGSVLEGPRSTVVIATDDGALLTPPTSLPILPGTTVRAVVRRGARTWPGVPGALDRGIADLLAAQGVWLLSSVTLAARVHTLDGVPLRPAPRAAEVAELVDAAILRDRLSGRRKLVVGLGVREYGRSYTGKEVVRQID